MGSHAKTVQNYLCSSLNEAYPAGSWESEFDINGTPVDIGGITDDHLYLIELEWRRADPADNAAKVFRHLQTGEMTNKPVTLVQIFTNYYKLSSGGVSSKRKNAEFIGKTADQSHEKLSYLSADLDINPPKRGEEWSESWKEPTERIVADLSRKIE